MARQPGRWSASRAQIARSTESRRFVDDLLNNLAAANFRPSAWAGFLARSLVRSASQARVRPMAAAELTALHLLAAAAGRRSWAAVSWTLTITHLGLLGERSTLGWPNRLTLVRALLPAVAPDSRWTSLVALSSDFVDGLLARRGAESAFGAFADTIADGVFWSWYELRWERSRWLRWAPMTVFAAVLGATAIAYFARARTVDYPRPMAARYASGAAQVALALRHMRQTVR